MKCLFHRIHPSENLLKRSWLFLISGINIFSGKAISKKYCLYILSLLFPSMLFSQYKENAVKRVEKTGIQLTNLKMVARITGTPLQNESLPSPNNTTDLYDVGGTDLGIMWSMGANKVGIFFGDTNGKGFVPSEKGGGNGGNWRSNVVAFSSDIALEDGLTISGMYLDGPATAGEVCAGAKDNPKVYQTSIPTSAIRVRGVDYVHYMNIYEWAGKHGRWLTNFSSVYASEDGGATWNRREELTFGSESKFSQITYARKNGYVFMVGTLAGRGSPAYLARVKEKSFVKKENYEYWNGESKKWIRNREEAATPIFSGPIGEASLLYHESKKRWILAYSYDAAYDSSANQKMHALVYRDAKELNGSWSDLKILATDKEYPGLYSPYFHPLKNKGKTVYFTMSLWKPYNVYLMKADVE